MTRSEKTPTESAGSTSHAEPTFEEALKELEAIVTRLESGSLGLDQSLKEYELGVRRLRQCHQRLESFERKIELLTGFDAQGNAVTEPFEESPTESLDEKQASRARRRSAKRADRSDRDEPQGLF